MYNGGVGRLLRILLRSLVESVSYIRRIYVQSSSHVDACYKCLSRCVISFFHYRCPVDRPEEYLIHTRSINIQAFPFIPWSNRISWCSSDLSIQNSTHRQ